MKFHVILILLFTVFGMNQSTYRFSVLPISASKVKVILNTLLVKNDQKKKESRVVTETRKFQLIYFYLKTTCHYSRNSK
jgi:hypothetical protein